MVKEFLRPTNGKVLIFLIIIIFAFFSYVSIISTHNVTANLVYTQYHAGLIGPIRSLGLLRIVSDVTKILHPTNTLNLRIEQNVSELFNSSATNLYEFILESNEEFRKEIERSTNTFNFKMSYISSLILFPTWSYKLYSKGYDFYDPTKFDFIRLLSPNILHIIFSIVYWYLIACLIVFGYYKIKNKSKKKSKKR